MSKAQKWEAKFHECLALEFSDPDYYQVHHILVVTYMLQSDRYDHRQFHLAKEILSGFLAGLSPEQLRKETGQGDKPIPITKKEGPYDIEKFPWNLDILSVRTENAGTYCSDVRRWAKDVLRILEEN